MNVVTIIAIISIFLHFLLALTCYYYSKRFWKGGEFHGGRYKVPKFTFFVVLCASSMCDLPQYIACAIKNGPEDCTWDDYIYVTCWCFHLIATCGYVYAIITPAILWSDIINGKDGKLFYSSSPLDRTKIFFRVSYMIFCANEFMDIVGALVFNDAEYADSNEVGAISNFVTVVMISFITFGCLWSGINLQNYVRNVKLGSNTEVKVLVQLNFTMFIIAATYCMRAVLVLSVFDMMPEAYENLFRASWQFPVWMLLTRWLPSIFCSFCLVNEMRFKATGSRSLMNGSGATTVIYQDDVEKSRFYSAASMDNGDCFSYSLVFGPTTGDEDDDRESMNYNLLLDASSMIPGHILHNGNNNNNEEIDSESYDESEVSSEGIIRGEKRSKSSLINSQQIGHFNYSKYPYSDDTTVTYNNSNDNFYGLHSTSYETYSPPPSFRVSTDTSNNSSDIHGMNRSNNRSCSNSSGTAGVDHFFTSSALEARSLLCSSASPGVIVTTSNNNIRSSSGIISENKSSSLNSS